MKILKIDQKMHFFEVVPQNLDDLWHLERVIEEGDLVSGSTERKIKPREAGEKPRKVKMFLDIGVKGVEFHESSGNLRISGVILGGKPEELIELKAHHTIDASPGVKIKVQKKQLKKWQIDRLEKARKATQSGKVLVVVLDDEAADFFMVKEFGFDFKCGINSGKSGKQFKGEGEGKYFSEIVKKVHEVGAERVVFAGPGFTKSNLKKYIEDKGIEIQAHYDSTNSVGVTGMNELLKSEVIEKVYKEFEVVKEAKLVDKIFEELGKNSGLVAYGFEEVGSAVGSGAVEQLLVCESVLLSEREKVESLMEKVEQLKGRVHIVAEENEAGKKLKGITGIVALLRYKL